MAAAEKIRRGCAALCLLALAGAATVTTAAGALAAAPAAAPAALTWSASTRQRPPAVDLQGVACTSANVCEAVGYGSGAAVALRTTDGGQHWSPQPLPARITSLSGIACPSADVCEAVGTYTNDQTFFSAGVIVGTANAGRSWRRQAIQSGTDSLNAITCPTVTRCLAVGFGFSDYNLLDYGTVLGTTDGGRQWSVDTLPAGSVSVSQATSVACPTLSVCYLGGNGGTSRKSGDVIFGSDDFGATWSARAVPAALTGGQGAVTALACLSATSCEAGDDLGHALVTTEGSTWTAQPVPRSTEALYGLSCRAGGTCTAVGNRKNAKALVLSKAAGGPWTAQSTPPGLGELAAVSCVSGTVCEAAGQNSRAAAKAAVIGTDNGGSTWNTQPLFRGITLAKIACGSASACVAVGTAGVGAVILGTSDSGRSWVRQHVPSTVPPDAALAGIACPSAGVCEAVGYGLTGPVALGTTDGGKTWVDQSAALPSGAGAFAGISCPSVSVCVAGGASSGLGFIVRTADGGATWTFQFLNFQATAVDGIDCLSATVCTALGVNGNVTEVLRTSDAGQTWAARTIKPMDFPTSIACATPTACEATGYDVRTHSQTDAAVVLGTTDGWDSSVRQVLPRGTTELFQVACLSAARCEAVGNAGVHGGVAVGTGDGGTIWSDQRIPLKVNMLTGISCLTGGTCRAAGLGATGGGMVIAGHS